MRLTVKASEVRAGDVLILPDGDIEVEKHYPIALMRCNHICLKSMPGPIKSMPGPIVRHRDELVVVERPERPVTITVELTPADADAWERAWCDRPSELGAYVTVGIKVRDAIRAARSAPPG